jgi:D-serine dehydratase
MQPDQILQQLRADPVLQALAQAQAITWQNPQVANFAEAQHDAALDPAMIEDAANRLQRFAPYLAKVFPETQATHGIIESELVAIPNFASQIAAQYQVEAVDLWLKKDSHLAISGSVKARGGIYEVLCYAEQIAQKHGLVEADTDYRCFASTQFLQLFNHYRIAVASTGNLGLSIGMMAARLGFQCSVHMSHDAKAWKKDRLRALGVTVIEHSGDYGQAIKLGRAEAKQDPQCYFIDDENSTSLFLGYAVAGQRLKTQLHAQELAIDTEHPLFVYLPCGVGGAPGGIAFGLKHAFGDAVRIIFAEPTQSPCMLLGLYTGLHQQIAVQDIGLSNLTIADGLAVGRPSRLVSQALQRCIDICYSLSDHELNQLVKTMYQQQHLLLEPSALAGSIGFARIQQQQCYQHFSKQQLQQGRHIVWATGGGMLPPTEAKRLLA